MRQVEGFAIFSQLIAKDQDAAGGKLSNKARNSYDERLVE